MKIGPVYKSDVARSVPFDNSTNGFASTDVQSAIEEIIDPASSGGSATPAFTFGRSGNVNGNTYLLNEAVPSNIAGHTVKLTGAIIKTVTLANENVNTFDVSFYHHDGNETALTLLGTVSCVAARTAVFNVNIALTTGRQLAAKVSLGTAKNLLVDLIVKGTF